MPEKIVKGYPFDKPQEKQELVLRTYEYDLPFNYKNIDVYRRAYHGSEFHGMELLTRNKQKLVALKNTPAEQWTRLRIVVNVIPVAEKGRLFLWINGLADDACVWIANAFAGYVPEDWDENADIPKGTQNLLDNPTFSGDSAAPEHWKLKKYTKPVMNHYGRDDNGFEGLFIEDISADLYTEFAVAQGKRLVMQVWVKSNRQNPGEVVLAEKWLGHNDEPLSDTAPDCIILREEEPIVRVAVIGSACTPPGYVALEAEPCEEFYQRGDYIKSSAPVRFRQNNLWGMHLRADQWMAQFPQQGTVEDIPRNLLNAYPFMENVQVKSHYSQFPMTGMSCAIFEIPKSRKVIITGGSEVPIWTSDFYSNDDHYSFRIIRTTVVSSK